MKAIQRTRSYSVLLDCGVDQVIQERLRQTTAEGFDIAHDDAHTGGQLATAAVAYALHAISVGSGSPPAVLAQIASTWPADLGPFKPKGLRRDLVRAGALILAELDRLDRVNARASINNRPRIIT